MRRYVHRARLSVRCLTVSLVATMVGLTSAVALTVASPLPASAAGGISVSVGYADNIRANPANFPTPWEGSPNVIFEGCTPTASCELDAGAIMVFNNTASAVTVNSVVLHMSTCTYDLWPHDVTLPAGAQLIVTQTLSGSDNGCTSNGRMDTSDVGPNGVGWSGMCTQSGVIPVVDVTINGTTSSFQDTGQVLNTGGVDAALCPHSGQPAGNESTQWTPIGSAPCFGAVLTLAPPTQSDHIGSTATVTATLTNDCGTPLPGVSVDFSVVSGPNSGRTGSATTGPEGTATFTYSSATTGNDVVQASVTNAAGSFQSNPVTVAWTNAPPNCSAATASPSVLWLPNHKLVPVTISGVTDPNGDPVTVTVTGVTQDEPVNGLGDGDTAPDAVAGSAPNQVLLRAERSGRGDGRAYVISFTASDGLGGTCTGTVTVSVPHDQSGAAAVDSGQSFNSFGS